ncbi:hypothetical protein SB719_01740 [Pantoea sp. SIMBA_079]
MKPDEQPSFKRLKEQARDNFCNSFQRLAASGLRRCLEEAKKAKESGND